MKKQKYLLIAAIFMIIALLSSCNQTETITCGACGATISSDIKFCSECGANLAAGTTLAPEVTQAPNSTSESEENQTSETTTESETTEAPHVHVWSEWATTLEVTCTAEGKQERSCPCGEKENQSIPALGHTEVIDSAVAATCTTSGLSDGKHCNVCGVITVAQQYVAALGHNEEILSAVAPTCTQEGKTEGKICKTCNATFVFQTQIPATGHTSVIDKAVSATCTESGLTEGKHCSICNAVIVAQTTVNALGHTEVIDKAVAATCTVAGKTEGKHCSKCNVVILSQNTIPATGHKYNSGTITKQATCVGDGQKTFACVNANCKHSYTEAIKATTYSATELYDLAVQYVGEIIVYDKSGKELALGTGFVYSSDGKIITNYHVIEDAYSAKITINGKTYNIASILAYDEDIDLAILKINASNMPAANICKQPTKTGENIYAIGSSRGLTNTFSQGMITQSNRIIDGVTYIQHDASITNGNSGGPLINVYGEVIGINTWLVVDSQNLNFAVFVSELDNLVFGTPMTFAELYEKTHGASANLLQWLLENYNVKNDTEIRYDRSTSTEWFSLAYDYGLECFNIMGYWEYNSHSILVRLYFYDDPSTYIYSAIYSENGKRNTTRGFIDARTFTRSAVIKDIEFVGDYWTKDSLLNVYQDAICDTLDWFEYFLNNKELGICIKDFGFDIYEVDKNNSAYDKLIDFIIDYGDYDNSSGKVIACLKDAYDSVNEQYYSVEFVYKPEDDSIFLFYYVEFAGTDISFTTGMRIGRSANTYYYASVRKESGIETNMMSGNIIYETFDDTTLVGYDTYEGRASEKDVTRENASISVIYLIEWLEWVAENYLDSTIADFGFIAF